MINPPVPAASFLSERTAAVPANLLPPGAVSRYKSRMRIRTVQPGEWDRLAALIHRSTNAWYARNLGKAIFPEPAPVCRVFPEEYEALDPGCALVAEDEATGDWLGSCFVHPRESHVSLGIMNTDPAFAGRGAARALLAEIIRRADALGLPVRLVSSAMNLDSYSLYTRSGFSPRELFQDLLFSVPADGPADRPARVERVRAARADDLPALLALDRELAGVSRARDFHHFLANRSGIWSLLVLEDGAGGLNGYLGSVNHPGSRLIGPGAMRDDGAAEALIWAQWDRFRGHAPVLLAPARCERLVQSLYRRGARNCELHVLQARGDIPPLRGVVMPTFLPETL